MSVTTHCSFGNPWHGRLGAGSIELVPGTPITEIAVDGVAFPVLTVSDLGNTRYLKAPGLSVPSTPAAIAALHGAFLNDAVLFSAEYRYSPLCAEKVVVNANQWLLYDGTALRWRKMNFGHTLFSLSTSPVYPSAPGTPAVEIRFDRGIVFGSFDRLSDASTGDATTYLGAVNLLLTYAYTPLTRPSSYPYDPTSRLVSIAVRPDGRAILIRLEAQRWSGFTISDAPGLPGPFDVYDTSHKWIFNVWEIVFNDDGSVAGTPTEVWPAVANVTNPVSWLEIQLADEGAVYWDYEYVPTGTPPYYRARYHVPCTFNESANDVTGYGMSGYETSAIVNADYDKDGNKRLYYFRMSSYPVESRVRTANGYIGQYVQNTPFDPADHIPSYTLSTALFHHEPRVAGDDYYITDYPGIAFVDWATTSTTVDANAICGVYEDGVAVKTWTTQPPGTLSWRWKTNNVAELYTGSTSHLRIGPGAVDDTAIASTGYASFNPRSGVVVSSVSPIGFV